MKNKYIALTAIVVVIIAVLIIWIFLPLIAKNQINKQIDEIEGYSGEVQGVSMQLFKGGIQVHDLTLFNDASNDPTYPFLTIEYADVTISWKGIFNGQLVVVVILDQFHMSFALRDDEITEEEVDPIPLDELLDELIPFSINLFRITNGTIGYKDVTTSPEVDIYLSDFFLEAKNIQNFDRAEDTLPATLHVTTRAMNSGTIILDAGLNLMKEIPDFEYNIEIENVDLTHFNSFFEAYANFNVNEGLLNIYSESAAHNGLLKGYVKPMIENLEITPVEDDASALQKIYEVILEGIGNLLESGETEHIGTRVEFEGRIDDPDVDAWHALWLLIRNGFFESVSTDLDHTIDFDDFN